MIQYTWAFTMFIGYFFKCSINMVKKSGILSKLKVTELLLVPEYRDITKFQNIKRKLHICQKQGRYEGDLLKSLKMYIVYQYYLINNNLYERFHTKVYHKIIFKQHHK